MNLEEFRDYCLAKKGVTESFPFGEDTLVFKVMGKMFALTSLSKWDANEHSVNLKCEPEKAVELREEYPEQIYPGYHMNKKHWNSVEMESTIPHRLLLELIDHSYELVVSGLTKKEKKLLSLK